MPNPTMTRHPYGLDSGPEGQGWYRQAVCARDPELWFTGRYERDGQARHICLHHCPVLRPCHAEAVVHRPTIGVQGGLLWRQVGHQRHGEPAQHQPAVTPCGQHCRDWRIA